jgi:hypothetical protein
MYVDARYHILTLISVFIALAIGMMVGAAVVSKKSLNERSVEMADRQRREAEERGAVEARERVKAEQLLERSLIFQKELFAAAVEGKLAGREVSLISLGSSPEVLIDAKKAIELAGAEVVLQAKIRRNFPPGGDALQALAEKLGLTEEGQDPSVVVVRKAAQALIAGTDDAALRHLYESGYIDFQGKAGRPGQVTFVLIGGHSDSARETLFDAAFAEAGRSVGASLVGCETTQAKYSSMVVFQERGLPTVDNIDEVIGRYSLVRVIGGAKGDFGTKDTAERLVPGEPIK